MITLLIPSAIGHVSTCEIERSIEMQTEQVRVVTCGMPQLKNKRESEADCRNYLKLFAANEFTAWKDIDVVYTSPTDISDCVNFLTFDNEWDAVALNTKKNIASDMLTTREENGHVTIACFVIRTDVLKKISFRLLQPDSTCLCRGVNRDCRIRYLDSRLLAEDQSGHTDKQPKE